MYKEFRIKNFRCFENLEIKNLKRINLFAGKNKVVLKLFVLKLILRINLGNVLNSILNV